MDNEIEKQNLPYDLTVLKKGPLYKKKTYRYGIGIFLIVALTSIVFEPLFGKFAITRTLVVSPSNFVNPLLLLLMIFFGFVIIFAAVIKGRLYVKARTKFAENNDLAAINEAALRTYLPGSVIRSGAHDEELVGYRLKLATGSAIVIDYSYVIGSGKNSTSYVYAIATMQFNKEYPHIFLDSRSNGTAGRYQSSQRVELEGNFNKYFDLFMPEGSSAGSLTVLSPDFMQTLINQAQPFDVEIDINCVSLITTGYGFTQENLAGLIKAGDAIYKEFSEINRSWQPVYNLQGKPFDLKQKNPWKRIFIIVLIYFAYQVLRIISSH